MPFRYRGMFSTESLTTPQRLSKRSKAACKADVNESLACLACQERNPTHAAAESDMTGGAARGGAITGGAAVGSSAAVGSRAGVLVVSLIRGTARLGDCTTGKTTKTTMNEVMIKPITHLPTPLAIAVKKALKSLFHLIFIRGRRESDSRDQFGRLVLYH